MPYAVVCRNFCLLINTVSRQRFAVHAMKSFFFLAALPLLIMSQSGCRTQPKVSSRPVPDNSRQALDWSGTYQGKLPCRSSETADCEGIETIITLNDDRTYTLKRKLLGREDTFRQAQGTFVWDSEGNRITLRGDENAMYLIGENRLIQLDKTGELINGPQAPRYVLGKLPAGLLEKYWKLIELSGRKIPPPTPGRREAHLILKTEGSRLTGNGGCNGLLGTDEVGTNNRIRFNKVATTLMACPDMQTEDRFLEALNTADSYTLKGDTLILNHARMAPLARLVAVYH